MSGPIDRKLRFGLVGAGGIAQTYAQSFSQAEWGQLAAVADVRLEAARAMAESLSAKSFPSHEAMAGGAGLDAVIVCTPPSTHPEICTYFLDRGIPVLCEKPLAIDSASARRMLDAAAATGTLFTMASKFRYVDDVVRARSILLSGILGEVVLFENAFTSRVDMSSRWNSNPVISGGGVLIDNGTHSLDIMRFLLGPLAEIQVVEGKRSQGLAVEETVRVFVHTQTGVMGSIDLSWSIQKELDSFISIYGTHGVVSVGWKESKYRQISSRDWVVFGHGYNKLQALHSQMTNFARAILGEEKLLITPEEAVESVEVIETAYRALQLNHWTPITASARLPEPVATVA